MPPMNGADLRQWMESREMRPEDVASRTGKSFFTILNWLKKDKLKDKFDKSTVLLLAGIGCTDAQGGDSPKAEAHHGQVS